MVMQFGLLGGNCWCLKLKPRRGFLHLVPPHQYHRFRKRGYLYHITIAMRNKVREAPKTEDACQALRAVYHEFREPRKVRLQVRVVQNNNVVCVWHSAFQSLRMNIQHLRQNFASHCGLPDPSISM